MKKNAILSLFIAIVLILLTSCFAPNEPQEENVGDTVNPVQPETPKEDTSLALVSNGIAKFNIVFSSESDADTVAAVNSLVKELISRGINVNYGSDKFMELTECEILIGSSLYGRDEAKINPLTLGYDGFTIRTVGNRLVIAGGDDSSTVVAINAFINIYLKDGDKFDGSSLCVERGTLLEVKQSDYPVKHFDIADNNLNDYYINVTDDGKSFTASAEELRDRLYAMTGIYLDIRENDYSSPLRFELCRLENVANDRFTVMVNYDGTVIFSSGNERIVDYGVMGFMSKVLKDEKFRISLSTGTVYSLLADSVVYSAFGAVGDGVTDDFASIVRAHEYANKHGMSVKADEGATYYIGSKHTETAKIRTDTDWLNAKFIIDDSEATVEEVKRWVFTVESDSDSAEVTVPRGMTLSKGQGNIGISFEEDKLLYLTNSKDIIYRRYGVNQNDGSIMQEMILVDKDGNVDPSTPIIWDYSSVTSIKAYSVSDKPIIVKGGVFTTYANNLMTGSCYAARGIMVSRSNTTLHGISHYVTGEPASPSDTIGSSASYNGFIHVEYATDVLVDSCVFTGRRHYKCSKTPDGVRTLVSQGTYDIVANRANNVTWKDCVQSNSIFDKQYWGIMASNFSKNLNFDGSALSRFDAHMGVHNMSIVNSKIGQAINLIGSGTAYFENVEKYGSNNFITLRSDYGATWDGEIIIKSSTLIMASNTATATLINASWAEHDFGYACYIPSVIVDGLTIRTANGDEYAKTVGIFANFKSNNKHDLRQDETNPLIAPKYISVIGGKYTYDVVLGKNNDGILSETEVTIDNP